MKPSRMDNLKLIIDDLLEGRKGTFAICVVTNERGLIVAGRSTDGSSTQSLAAMISLLSDTSNRVNENLGYGHPLSATVRTFGTTVLIREFLVRDKWFRIGAVMTQEKQFIRRFFRKQLLNPQIIEERLIIASENIRHILET